MNGRRWLDVVAALVLLACALPVMLLIALRVALDRSGSVLYRELRVGQGGRPFVVHKFRTLRAGSATDPRVAVGADPRITRPGRWLRRTHLDELPQLYDVLRGVMSSVGPRPYAADNLTSLDAATRAALLAHRSGLTGPAAVEFFGEDDLLATAADPAAVYRDVLVPAKTTLDLAALAHRSVIGDSIWLLRTAWILVSPRARARARQRVSAELARAARVHV